MLSSIRNNRKALSIVLWLVIIAFVATIFVVWGVGEKSNTLSYVAKVNDKIITYDEYQNRYKLADDEIRRYGGAVQIDNLSKRILESLVNEKLMLIEAEKLNIPATDLELVSYIRTIPSFQVNGEFNIDQYEMVLRNNGLNAEQYEKAVKDEIKMRKMTNLIYQTQSIATEKEIENEYNYRKSNITVDYAAVPLNTFEKNIPASPDEAALKEYYDRTKEIYRVPAEIKVKYVSFDKNKFLDTYKVSDEQAKEYYNNNIKLYDKKESADVSLIYITANSSDNKSMEAAKAKIDEAYAKLQAGKSFAETADNYTDKNIVPAEGGHIGIVEKGSFEKDIETAVFSTAVNTYSKPVKVTNGYVIAYVNNLMPAKKYTFEEKKDEIKETIKTSSAAELFNKYLLNEFQKIADKGSITAIQKANPEYNANVTELDFIAENAVFPVTAVAIKPETKAALYKLSKGELSQTILDGSMAYIFEIVDKKPSYIPEIDKIKQQLTVDYKVDKITKEGIKALESDLADSGFEKTASKYNAQIKNVSFVRDNAELQSVFKNDTALTAQIIKTKSGDFLQKPFLLDDNFYIFKVAKITPPEKSGLENEKENISNYISSIKGNAAIEGFAKKALEKADVKFNQDFLRSMNIVMP